MSIFSSGGAGRVLGTSRNEEEADLLPLVFPGNILVITGGHKRSLSEAFRISSRMREKKKLGGFPS
jgi:hypothetical protein